MFESATAEIRVQNQTNLSTNNSAKLQLENSDSTRCRILQSLKIRTFEELRIASTNRICVIVKVTEILIYRKTAIYRDYFFIKSLRVQSYDSKIVLYFMSEIPYISVRKNMTP